MPIDWNAFDWPSFATLVTGVVAVGGAVFVGVKQAGISKRQADISAAQTTILSRQTELATLQLRHALFERRYAVYAATRDYLDALTIKDGKWQGEVQSKFVHAMKESRFLFRDAVHAELRVIWNKSLRYALPILEMTEMGMTLTVPGDDESGSSRLNSELTNHLNTLVDLFGDEMQLREPDPHIEGTASLP